MDRHTSTAASSLSDHRNQQVQRSIAPGKMPRVRTPVQRHGGGASSGDIHSIAAEGFQGSSQGLPHGSAIQQSFGMHDVSGVQAYVGGAASSASEAMGAEAYASGDSVAFKSSPDLFTAAHEAAHIVQQRSGVQLSGGVGQAGDAYERHADKVAETVVSGGSAESLLGGSPGGGAPTTQRKVQFLRAEPLGPDNMSWAEPVRVSITASRLNVRTSPDSSGGENILGQYEQGATAAVNGRQGDWLMVDFNGQAGYIHGGYVTPLEVREPEPDQSVTTAPADTAPATTTPDAGAAAGAGASAGDWLNFWPFTSLWPTNDQPADETVPPTPDEQPANTGANTTAGNTTAGTGTGDGQDTNPETNPVLRLAHDFNNVPVFARGEAAPDHQPSTYQTPYFLNSSSKDVKWSGRGAVKNLTIAQGRAHAGQKVSDVISGRPWVGKGVPEEMQIIGQAVIDNAHDGQTPSTIQAYVNAGAERAPGRINGKWGVDCSGFTGQMMHELEGNERSADYTSTNAASFKHDGSRDFTPINPQDARMGDVISFESTNHVVVVFAKWDVRLPLAGGDTSQTKGAVMLGLSESGASQDSASGQFVRTDRRFFYFPDATSVLGKSNPSGNEHRLANSRTETLPHWQPELSNVSYAGNAAWTDGYTLNCPGDSNGTNVRVRGEDGRFTSTSTVVANGAGGVLLKEVEGDMVRIQVNGVDMQDGQTMWAPARYAAQTGASYSIPRSGQPVDRNPKLFSVVRNPTLNEPQEGPADDAGE